MRRSLCEADTKESCSWVSRAGSCVYQLRSGWRKRSRAMRIRRAAFALLICCPVLSAQEVRYVDLTAVEQRTELRYPHAAETSRYGSCGGGNSWTEGEGPDIRDPHALGVYLTHRTATQINPTQPF